jgi:hypothetical protein
LSGPDEHGEGEWDENGPPRKRRALLLPAPEPGEGVPEANRFVWKGKGKAWDPAAAGASGAVPPDARRDDEGKHEGENVEGASRDARDEVEGAGTEDEGAGDNADEGTERSTEAGSEAGDDDEFAKLVSGMRARTPSPIPIVDRGRSRADATGSCWRAWTMMKVERNERRSQCSAPIM